MKTWHRNVLRTPQTILLRVPILLVAFGLQAIGGWLELLGGAIKGWER